MRDRSTLLRDGGGAEPDDHRRSGAMAWNCVATSTAPTQSSPPGSLSLVQGALPLDARYGDGDGESLQIEFTAVTNVEVVGARIDDGRGHKDLSRTGGGTDTGSSWTPLPK